jgi:putative tricarboxylic transport membrane protein
VKLFAAHRLAGVAVLALAAFFAIGLPAIDDQGGYAGLSPRFLPTVVTIGLVVCALALMFKPDSVLHDVDDARAQPARPRGFGWLAVGLVADMALIGQVGFVLASTLLLVCVARGYGSDRPLRDLLAGLALTVPMWLLFSQLLGISLPLLPLAGM